MSSTIFSAWNDFLDTCPDAPGLLDGGADQRTFCSFSGSAGSQGAVTAVIFAKRNPDRGVVLKISRESTSPHLAREAESLKQLRGILPPSLGGSVPLSLHVGTIAGRPYSVTTLLPGVNWRSLTPGWSRLLRHRMTVSAVQWIARLARETLQPKATGLDPAMLEALDRYVKVTADADAGRKAARALSVLKEIGDQVPRVVQQRDFWPGNILIGRSHNLSGVVDWEGALLNGLPGCDCVKLASSLYGRACLPYLQRYCAMLDHPAITTDVCIALAIVDIILTRGIVEQQIAGRLHLARGRTPESLIAALPAYG